MSKPIASGGETNYLFIMEKSSNSIKCKKKVDSFSSEMMSFHISTTQLEETVFFVMVVELLYYKLIFLASIIHSLNSAYLDGGAAEPTHLPLILTCFLVTLRFRLSHSPNQVGAVKRGTKGVPSPGGKA